jgi:uncharacterized lipoprotein YajG
MPKSHLPIFAAAALLALAACQENKEAPATNEPSEAPTPQATTPGAEVGTAGQDATATVEAGDSTQARAAHP